MAGRPRSPKMAEARRLVLEEGKSYSEVAEKLGITERTLFRWADEEAWAPKKVAINAAVQSVKENKPRETKTIVPSTVIPLLEIDRAIERLADAMDYVEAKSLEGCAKALKDLLEYRSKLNPTTAKELAEVAIDSGISPQQFLEELQRQWAERKAA